MAKRKLPYLLLTLLYVSAIFILTVITTPRYRISVNQYKVNVQWLHGILIISSIFIIGVATILFINYLKDHKDKSLIIIKRFFKIVVIAALLIALAT